MRPGRASGAVWDHGMAWRDNSRLLTRLPSLRLHAVQPRRLAWPPHSPAARERILPPQPHLRPFHNEGSGGPAQAASGDSGAGGGAHSKGLSVKYCSAPRNPSNPVSRPEADAGYSPGWRWPDFALHVAEKGFEAVWDAVPPPPTAGPALLSHRDNSPGEAHRAPSSEGSFGVPPHHHHGGSR